MFHTKDGALTLLFQHRRVHEWPPEGGISTICATVPLDQHGDQRAKSEALLASIGWQGPAMVEYRLDERTGTYWLMEINGRFWGSLPLAHHAGAEFAWETYAQAVGIETAQREIKERHARYTIPETRRLFRIFRGRRAITVGQYKTTPWRDLVSYTVQRPRSPPDALLFPRRSRGRRKQPATRPCAQPHRQKHYGRFP